MRWPGQKSTQPVFLQSVNTDQLQQSVLDRDGGPDKRDGDYKPFIPAGAGMHSGILRSDSRNSELDRSTSIGRSASRGSAYGQSKKVDFSLGVKDIASSDDSGDVFGDRRKMQHIPMVRVLEEREREEEEAAIARTTSRTSSDYGPGVVRRHRAGSGSIVSHRNRFFGSKRGSLDAPDLETGAFRGVEGHYGRLSAEVPRAGPSNEQQATVESVEDVELRKL